MSMPSRTIQWVRIQFRPPFYPLTRLAIGVVVGTVMVAAGLVGLDWLRSPRWCAEGVLKVDSGPQGECVGVTDGAYSFAPELDEVFARIKAENDRITETGDDYATVAFVIPMTSASAVIQEQIRREVQGAYLAQYRANHKDNERLPAIRLVLANPGRDSAHWRTLSDQLISMVEAPEHRLRLVVGFNASVANTAAALRYLTGHGIPVVTGPLTADDIGNSQEQPDAYPGMVKVVPNNRDQAAALASYHHDLVDPARTLLVEDRREGDNYVDTLREEFRAHTAGARYDSEQFTSPGMEEVGTTPNQFARMVDTICTSPTRWIYFAGRPIHLRVFINALGRRGCVDREFTVISSSGASTVANDPALEWEVLERGVSVHYSAIAHPDAWLSPDAPSVGGSAEELRRLEGLIDEVGSIGEVELTDSHTITMYDAVWTGISGVRAAGVGEVPSTEAIIDIWPRLHGPDHRVNGVSGWICLDNYGHAHNKAVAIVRLDPTSREDIAFLGLAWPEGEPPTPECLVTNPG